MPKSALNRAIPPLCLLVFLAAGLRMIAVSAYPGAFDELEHVSYAASLQETNRVLPRFEEQKILLRDDMSRWDDHRLNYLSHPSPFYVFVGLFLDRTLPPNQAVLLPRLASAGLLLIGVASALWAGQRHFAQDRMALLSFCTAVALCPKLLAVCGQVTNDSLAFLGGALAYWGASQGERPQRWPGPAAVALGLVFALWAKPNAGLAVGAWLGLVFALRAAASRQRPGQGPGHLLAAALAVGLAIGAIPYVFILRDYGALVPVTVEQFGDVRQLGDFATYLPAFLLTIGYTWSLSQTGTWPISQAGSVVAILLFWAVIGCAAAGGWSAARRPRPWGAREAIAAATPVAFVLVLPLHLWFASRSLGYSLPAASFRYYLPLWPPLAHAIAYGVMAARKSWQRVSLAGIGFAALAVGWASL